MSDTEAARECASTRKCCDSESVLFQLDTLPGCQRGPCDSGVRTPKIPGEQRPSGITNYTYDTDRLLSAGSSSYTYDRNGNQLSGGGTALTYDLANRVKTAAQGSTTTTYSYNGDGNRLQASTGSQATKKTNFLWDVNNELPQLALECNGSDALLRRYINGHRPLSMWTSSTIGSYYHYDPLGSVRDVTSSTGATQLTYDYEPYGTVRTQTGSSPTNLLKFTGEYHDPTGLYHVRARQYDPTSGRFLGRDPVEPASSSPFIADYIYAGNRPTLMVDPSGEKFESTGLGGQVAHFATSPDAARDLANAGPPRGWRRCGVASCDGRNAVTGWDTVRGKIFPPRGVAFNYYVRLAAQGILAWHGQFSVGFGPTVRLWVPNRGLWLSSPVIIPFRPTPYVSYHVKVASVNPLGQKDRKIDVEIFSPYRCTRPDPSGY